MSKNKDEEIKLYLNAITTRDPSKRQIKPVDKDAFQLFDDLESESDEDFVVGSDDFSDDQQVDESEEEEEEENESSADEDDKESSESSESVKKTPKIEKKTKQNEDNNDSLIVMNKTKLESVMICMMCLMDSSFSDNEIVECDGCGIVVHEDCYKISDNIFMSCDASDSSTDPWFCDVCLANISNPRCELCPVDGGVFKRTENNRWVHLLCALYTPGVAFNDIDNLSEITLSELPLRDWSARECSLCSNPFYARTGICISCDAGLCKSFFHVICAQKEGLLSEPNNEENSDDPYFANCRQHTDKETAKRRRKNWNAAVNRQKLRLEEWQKNDHYEDSRLIRKREFFSSMYSKFLESVPTPFVPKTKVPCYLETNPVAVFLFKKKATNLRLPQEVLNSQTSSDTKIVTSGIPVFGPDFITYFLDREKKIDETTSEIVRLESCRRDLEISEQNTTHQFNKAAGKKESVHKEYKSSLEQIMIKFDVIKQLVKHRELIELISNLMNKYELNNGCSSNENGTDSIHSGDKDSNSNNKTTTKIDSVINECYMCKSVSDQHMLIDCDHCRKYIHIGCLDPPLKRMPRKTKLYGWQCSICACANSEEEQTKQIDVNRPRQLRKSSDIRSKYNRIEEISSTKKFSQRLLKKTKQRSIITRTRSKSADASIEKLEPPKLEEIENDSSETPKSPINSTVEEPDCPPAPDIELPPENVSSSKPVLLAQRKSDRSRKRPLTLFDEFETTLAIKKPKIQKIIKPLKRKRAKSMITESKVKDNMLMVSLTSLPNLESLSTNDHNKTHKQPITFYPSSEASVSSKQSSESEQVQIGVVAKKSNSQSRDSSSGTQKGFEKKSILIKCHDHDDDDRVVAETTLTRFSTGSRQNVVDI